jgi:ATP-dependent HslUV protease subunit HslV
MIFRLVAPFSRPSGLNPKEDEDDAYESSRIDALIINPHGVFGVYSLREVFEYTRYWAIGSGSEYALGAMYALYDRLDSAEEIARAGVEAGSEFNNASSMPLTLYTLELAKEV